MTNDSALAATPFTVATSTHKRLQEALADAGIDPGDLPGMIANVSPLGEPRIDVGSISTSTADQLGNALRMRKNSWELRYAWTVGPGIEHPAFTYNNRPASRAEAVAIAWRTWPTTYKDLELAEVHVRALPDGEWEKILPVAASCDVRPADGTLASPTDK
jgi:hypothetical protein